MDDSSGLAWFPVSRRTHAVLEEARRVHALSGGAFDPTVAPLLRLWGFGPDAALRPPAPAELAAAAARVGLGRIRRRCGARAPA